MKNKKYILLSVVLILSLMLFVMCENSDDTNNNSDQNNINENNKESNKDESEQTNTENVEKVDPGTTVNAFVTILPIKYFVKKIGGNKVKVQSLVTEGSNPHTYEPTPQQMKDMADAHLYFSLDLEVDKIWLPKFEDLNRDMTIVEVGESIEKIEMVVHHHHEHDEEHEGEHDEDHEHEDEHDEDHEHEGEHDEDHEHEGEHDEDHEHEGEHDEDHEPKTILDPHIWLSTYNATIIADNILEALLKKDPKNSDYYIRNHFDLIESIKALRSKINDTMKVSKARSFMVFHPAWGYFAKDFNIEQIPIEIEGQEPTPQEMVSLIEKAKRKKIDFVLVSPQFPKKSARMISENIGAKIISVNPLAENWYENMIHLSESFNQ